MRTYYDMLSVARDAPSDEIKKAFRREIARYHPDKVQHLGPEFQDMAAGIAADLTEAYRILMDPALRAKYDHEMRAGPPPPRPGPPPQASAPPPPPPPRDVVQPQPTPSPQPRPTAAGLDFVKRAALSRIREAIQDVLGGGEPFTAPGFDIAIVTRPKKSFFKKPEESLCLVVKFVAFVDADVIRDVWLPASKVRAPGASECAVILLGPGMAPPSDLSSAISQLRKKARNTGPLLVPVDVRDWEALFPPETPGPVRSLIQRLKDGTQ